jgi:hypothetical protein
MGVINMNPYESPRAATVDKARPVKVKAYGLIPLTRNGYLSLQIVLAVAFVALVIGLRPVFAAPGHPWGFINEYWLLIIVVVLALEALETVVMLGKFRKAEGERRKGQGEGGTPQP